MPRQVEVTVGVGGGIKIEASGFKGQACEKATAEIEKMLGVGAQRTKKPEFYQQESISQRQSQG